MSNEKIYDQASVAFQRLSPNEGDVVTVSLPDDIAHEQMAAFAQILEPLVEEHGVSIIFLTKGVTLATYDESEMNKQGWFRFDPKQMN